MSENDNSSAPAGDNAVHADPMKRGSAVDLSDLQAELDKTAEHPKKDAGEHEDAEEATEGDDAETDADDDPFKDEDDEGDSEDDDESDEDGEDEGDEAEKAKKKRSRADRYNDRIKRLEAENAQLRSRTTAVSEKEITAEVERRIGAEPQEKDFPDYLTYEKEHTAWLLDKRQETRRVKAEAQQDVQAQARQNAERAGAHKERVEQFGKSGLVKDFNDVMTKAKDAKVSPIVEDLVLDSEKSGHLVYYFAKNPNRLAAINAMNQRDAAREIGRIEARLSLPKPRTETRAPAPKKLRPGGGASAPSQEGNLDSWLNKTYGKGRR
jgi:hypothetical protein